MIISSKLNIKFYAIQSKFPEAFVESEKLIQKHIQKRLVKSILKNMREGLYPIKKYIKKKDNKHRCTYKPIYGDIERDLGSKTKQNKTPEQAGAQRFDA